MPEQPFTHRLRVRYYECDPQGVVFNGNYFHYFDVAMTEFHREVIGEYSDLVEDGLEMVVAEANARYRAPAHFDEELEIELLPGRLGDSSLTIQLVVKRAETVIVEGELRYVFVDGKTRKKSAVPAEVRAALAPYLKPAGLA
jgi:acyl-CoA thioester hydrolase